MLGILISSLLVVSTLSAENWPAWRGPRNDGSSQERDLPTTWGPTENIAWKAALPGAGHSSPIVWEDHVFVTTALPAQNTRLLLALNRRSGQIRWQAEVMQTGPESIHRLNSRASGTPATDGKRVYTAFLRAVGDRVIAPNVDSKRLITPGKIVLTAHDFNGHAVWSRELGDFLSAHGFNSSPILYRDLVILNGDHDGEGYLVAVDQESGEERWRIAREHNTRSYVTPLIRTVGNRTQMVLSGSHAITSYDPITGHQHWKIDGPTEQFVASLVYDGHYFFATGGYPEKHILALRPDGEGNVTDTHIAWRTKRGAAYVPSPIISGPYLLIVADSGIASCFDSQSGKRLWMERLPGGHSASPVVADSRVYFVSDRGVTSVIRPGAEFKVEARNDLKEDVSASPAISQGLLYLRTHQHLYAIGAKQP